MTLDAQTLREVVGELQPLLGGRIQRVDVVRAREIVLELRYPGRTLKLLVSALPGAGRVHLVDKRPPRELPGGDLQSLVRKRLEGRALVALESDRLAVELDAGERGRLLVRLDGGRDAFHFLPPSGRTPPVETDPARLPERFPLSEEIARRYALRVPEGAERALRAELARSLLARRKKLQKLAANLTHDRDRLTAMEAGSRFGELLKPLLAQIARGQPTARALDWETGETIDIPLDPALSAKKNMERFFDRAKKAQRGLPIVLGRLTKATAELQSIDRARSEIEHATLEILLERAGTPGTLRVAGIAEERGAGSTKKSSMIARWARRFEAADGAEILVGKGARENDRLTFSVARGDDVWLHASGTSGAHVILRVPKGKEPGREALIDAAQLAAHYSGAGSNTKVDVIYTEARHVRKTKGDPPGRVSVAKGRTLLIHVDEERMRRLFGRAKIELRTADS